MINLIALVALFFVVDGRYLHIQDEVYKSNPDYQKSNSNQTRPYTQLQKNERQNYRNQNFRRQINERLSNVEKKLEQILLYMQRPQDTPQPQISFVPYIIPLPLPIPVSYYEYFNSKANRTENSDQDLGVTVSSTDSVIKDNDDTAMKVKEPEINSPKREYSTPNTYVTEKTSSKINDLHNDFAVVDSKTERTVAKIDDLDKDVRVSKNKTDTLNSDKTSSTRLTTTSTSKIYETNISSTTKIYESEISAPQIYDLDKDTGKINKSYDRVHDKDVSIPEISLPKPKPKPVEDGSKQVRVKTLSHESIFLKPSKCHAAIFTCCRLQRKADVQDCFIKYDCAKTFATKLSCTDKIQDVVFEIYQKHYGQ